MIRKGCLYGLGCLVFFAVLPWLLIAATFGLAFALELVSRILRAI